MAVSPVSALDNPPTSVEIDPESSELLERLTDLYRDAYRNGQALNSVAELLRGCPEGYAIGAADLHVLISPWSESVNTLADDFFSLCRGFREATERPSAAAPGTITLRVPPELADDDAPVPDPRRPEALVEAVTAWVDARCGEGEARLAAQEGGAA